MSTFITKYEGPDGHGMPVWSCRREGGGLVAYGRSDREALQNFVELEDEVAPLPSKSRQVFSSQFEPPEFIDEPPREEDYL
jgi:hypothetical protein